jgi:Flp pilus assembly protein TadG
VSECGSGLIEFTLLMMLLMLSALGVFDFGMAIEQGIVISAAAHDGAEYGAAEGNANNTTGMQTAALNAAKAIIGFSATATTWCTCTAGGATVSCTSTCSTYYIPIQYVQVKTSATVPVLIKFPGLPDTIPLTGSATLRAR